MKTVGEIIANGIDAALKPFQDSIIPIFAVNDRDQPVLLGSGVLVEVSGDVFLCTAKHVTDENSTSNLYIDGPLKLEQFTGVFYGNDRLDVAVCRLSSEQKECLVKYKPLQSNMIASATETLAARYSAMMGFPESRSALVYGKNSITAQRYSVSGIVVQSKLARVKVSFKQKRTIDVKTRKRVHAPYPHGMSGGAMFVVQVSGASILGLKLIGILTKWSKTKSEIFGPSMAMAMAIVRDVWGVPIPARLQVPSIRACCITP